jgi:hypothetical protein
MNKEFVPHEPSLALKELGFDEPCLEAYDKNGLKYHSHKTDKLFTALNSNLSTQCSAPLYQQAFRWFREKYNIRQNIMDFIDDEIGIEWDYEIAIIGTDLDEKGNYKPLVDYSTDDETRKFKTYKEAELACLKKLIEIVKQK